MPRRMQSDANGDLWVGLWQAGKLMKVDYKTKKMTIYDTPTPNSGVYTTAIDKKNPNSYIWFSEHKVDRIGRFDPKTQQFLEFPLPYAESDARRVEIDPTYKDALGCFRPILRYDVSDYTWQGMVEATQVSTKIFDALGIPKTQQFLTGKNPNVADFKRYVAPDGKPWDLNFIGAGHHIGTHRMGKTKNDSVVNADQRSWDHENLYIVGCGSFPTTGTANPTLTAVALALRSTKDMLEQLR